MPAALSSVPPAAARILFVDDDADVQKAASLLLTRRGFIVLPARDPAEALSLLGAEPIDVVLLDLNFQPGATSGAEGFACLERLLAHDPDLVVVVVTGHSGITIAVAAMRAGAADFVMKPWNNERLVATLNDAASLARRRREARAGQVETIAASNETPVLIGESPAMRRLLDHIRRAAPTGAPILLLGEAGTGKSLLARTIHRLSPRAAHPLVTLDPASTNDSGLDPRATLLLDDIDAWPLPSQDRLLDFLPRHPGLRLLATTRQTHASLLTTMLRPDLLYRLNTLELTVPPLRERGDDMRLLAAHYLRLFARRYSRPTLALSLQAADAIAASPWTGNVRALVQAIERAVVLAPHDLLGPNDIPLPIPLPDSVDRPAPGDGDLNLSRSEKAIVAAALSRHAFNVSQAAKELGLTRAALYRRMARHGL